MRLNNSQYASIMRMYDARQDTCRQEMNRRTELVKAKIPEFSSICEEATSEAAQAAYCAIMGDLDEKLEHLARHKELSIHKRDLLEASGYPRDYLEPIYICDKCKDTGIVDGQKCSCFNQAAIDLLYNQSNIKKILLLENFSNFNYDWYSEEYIDPIMNISALENIVSVTDNIRGFLNRFPSGENLLFFGSTGVGKTYLTHCIAKELLDKGYSVLYLSAIDLFELFSRYTFDTDKDVDYREAFSQILDCDLLIIDDLGTEVANSFTSSKLFYCINERINSGVSTIISTNLNLQDIMNGYSERIFSRITMHYDIYKIFGDDIRLKKL